MELDKRRIEEESERARMEVELKLEIEAQRLQLIREGKLTPSGISPSANPVSPKFDVVTGLRLVPPFNEEDVDLFLSCLKE